MGRIQSVTGSVTSNLVKIKFKCRGFPLGCSRFCFVYIHKGTANGSQERLQFIKGGGGGFPEVS